MLLTEEEIAYLIDTAQGRRDLVNKTIAAYEAKLREQDPVAWMYKNKNTDDVYLRWTAPDESFKPTPLFEHPAPIPEGWISVNYQLPKVGRTPILVAVSWVKYCEHEDGTPTEATGVDVTEGEYIPPHGEAGGHFDSYQGRHGDIQHITHWMPLPAPPIRRSHDH